MSDNLTKGRIQKYINKITEAGLTVPDLSAITDFSAQEQILKKYWNENKPLKELPSQTKKEATESVKAVADDRVAALEKEIAQMKELVALAIKDKGTSNGITTDDILKALTKAADGKQNEYKLLRPEYIPADDLMEKSKVYFVANANHRVWGKRIGDHWTPPPFNLTNIHFKLAWGWVSREGNALEQKRISTFETKSKTIADWIESLPEFGRVIHLDIDEAMESSSNLAFATVHAKHYGALMGKNLNELTTMAAANGIGVRPQYTRDHYASKLGEKFANEEISRQRDNFDRQMRHNITLNAVTA